MASCTWLTNSVRRSWLSREVLLFSGFSGIAALYAAALWLRLPGTAPLGAVTTVLGLGGVTATACIYRVPSRPAWNTPFTLVQFHLTAAVLGRAFDQPSLALAAGMGFGFSAAYGLLMLPLVRTGPLGVYAEPRLRKYLPFLAGGT